MWREPRRCRRSVWTPLDNSDRLLECAILTAFFRSLSAQSDYAISQFYFLRRLLFVHGRLSLRRVSILVEYIVSSQRSEIEHSLAEALSWIIADLSLPALFVCSSSTRRV